MPAGETTHIKQTRSHHPPVATLYATDAFRQRLGQMPGLAAELADHLGWSRQLITNIKAGRRGVRPEDAPAFEGFLGQPVEVLFASAQQSVPKPNPSVIAATVAPVQAPADLVALEASLPLTLSAPALASLLGVSAATIYERVRDGTIRRVPLGDKGSRVLIPRSEAIRLATGL